MPKGPTPLFLVYGGKEAHVVLDCDAKGVICSGLNVLNGKMVDQNLTTWRKSVLPRGKPVTVVCTVRRNGIQVEAGGQKIFDWNGNPGSLSHDPNWTAALPKGKFAIGTWESVFKVSRISLQPFPPADAVVFQEKRFKLFAEQLSWHEAQRKCRAMGGRLAEVRSTDENDFLLKLASSAKQTGIWLGATDEVKEGTWLWSDRSGLAYNYFANGQPDRTKSGQHYLLMMIKSQRGQWCSQPDQSTEWTPGFICEWDTDDRDNTAQAASSGSVETEAWTELFNGHDLAGWVDAAKGTPAAWKVQENYMEATPNVSIMTARRSPLTSSSTLNSGFPKRTENRDKVAVTVASFCSDDTRFRSSTCSPIPAPPRQSRDSALSSIPSPRKASWSAHQKHGKRSTSHFTLREPTPLPGRKSLVT